MNKSWICHILVCILNPSFKMLVTGNICPSVQLNLLCMSNHIQPQNQNFKASISSRLATESNPSSKIITYCINCPLHPFHWVSNKETKLA